MKNPVSYFSIQIHFSPSIEELDNMVYYVGKDMITSLCQIQRLIEKYPKEGVAKLVRQWHFSFIFSLSWKLWLSLGSAWFVTSFLI